MPPTGGGMCRSVLTLGYCMQQVQAIFNKMDKELLEHYPDPALAPWATLPATLERAKLRPAPVENLSIDNKVGSCPAPCCARANSWKD